MGYITELRTVQRIVSPTCPHAMEVNIIIPAFLMFSSREESWIRKYLNEFDKWSDADNLVHIQKTNTQLNYMYQRDNRVHEDGFGHPDIIYGRILFL